MSAEDKDDEKLWQLLGKAKRPAISPFFARNVLRAVRTEQEGSMRPDKTSFQWLLRRWRFALGGALAVLALGFAMPSLVENMKTDSPIMIAQQNVTDPDYDAIEHLDELLAYDESSLWLDDATD